ncbi:MAG: hypothetical protein IBX61_02850 [Thermoleophilia bacterium]|nr:hypothetical protein [Thermoleophilia bacterium]
MRRRSRGSIAAGHKAGAALFFAVLVTGLLIAGAAGAADTPAIVGLTSPTHPDPDVWYANSSPEFSWSSSGDSAVVGAYSTQGDARGVTVAGNHAIVAAGNGGLQIIDISNPANPSKVGSYKTPSYAYDVAVSAQYAYVVYGVGMQIFDISEPASPRLTSTYNTPGTAYGVHVSGSYALVADRSAGLQIVDVSNPQSPVPAGTFDTPGSAMDVAVAGQYAFVADGAGGLRILDISDPAGPEACGLYRVSGNANGVAVSGSHAFVAYGALGMRILDISNPAAPSLTGAYNTPGDAQSVTVSGMFAYVADGSAGLQIIDISTPASPALEKAHDTPGISYDVDVSDGRAYVADGSSGLQIISPGGQASAYSYILDQQPETVPDEVAEGSASHAAYADIPDGEWYFHVRAGDESGDWGPASHLRFRIDTTAPQITDVKPSGTIGTDSAVVSAYYADALSGIDTGSVTVSLDGTELNGCDVTGSGVSCPVSGLGAGQHDIEVNVADNAGNAGAAHGSFEAATGGSICGEVDSPRPSLTLSLARAYWPTYADYTDRNLSVEFTLRNNLGPDALDVNVVGTYNTSSVSLVTEMPRGVGEISRNSESAMTLVYNLPPAAMSFKTTVYATASNECGDMFSYPGPYDG